MTAKKILMIVGDYVEDYEAMVPFQALPMVSHIDKGFQLMEGKGVLWGLRSKRTKNNAKPSNLVDNTGQSSTASPLQRFLRINLCVPVKPFEN